MEKINEKEDKHMLIHKALERLTRKVNKLENVVSRIENKDSADDENKKEEADIPCLLGILDLTPDQLKRECDRLVSLTEQLEDLLF